METKINKEAQTDYHIIDVMKRRWSPLSFNSDIISKENLNSIFEAARWAASAFNEQPWLYVYARKGTKGFDQLWDCLADGNKPWTKNANILFLSIAKTTFSKNGKPNVTALHDVGMANAQLMLQAMDYNIHTHLMGGFDPEKVKSLLSLKEHQVPICMGAMGYLGPIEQLDNNYAEREAADRSRKSINEFIIEMT